MRRKRNKYGNKRKQAGGESFDSGAEGKYYRSLLKAQEQGVISKIELQPTFVLQPKFEKNGVKHQAITYKADFRVTYSDGRVEIVDVKGAETAMFKLKHKMFEYCYPDLELIIKKV